ncbi:MAG TPA: hypothetical protein VLA19_10010 [Herpetosiphonaceae bacterium]|nr:hypothetical protein [Herpetosiphonaceae bacterium]
MPELPAGTVTFLFTDIEGSTARWEQERAAMQVAQSSTGYFDAILTAVSALTEPFVAELAVSRSSRRTIEWSQARGTFLGKNRRPRRRA